MILTVSFHFRDPFIPNIIILISLILLQFGNIIIKKNHKLKGASLLIIGSSIAILWYIIDFFIPGILLPMVPTPEDLEFTRIYGFFFAGLIQDVVLILSLGILPLAVFFLNRSSNSIYSLALGAFIIIISIVLGYDLFNLLLLTIFLTTAAISMAFFAYYGYKIKNLFLILFALSFIIAHLLLPLML